jgi:hypothetical protein
MAPNNPEPVQATMSPKTHQYIILSDTELKHPNQASLTLCVCSNVLQIPLHNGHTLPDALLQVLHTWMCQPNARLYLRTCPLVADRVCFDLLLYEQDALLLLSTHLKSLQDDTQHTTAHFAPKAT